MLGIGDDPVTIKQVEVEIANHAFGLGYVRPQPAPAPTGFKVAVVGSGPAGLLGDDGQQRTARPAGVHLLPVADALLHRAAGRDLAAVLEKALRVSHRSVPPSK